MTPQDFIAKWKRSRLTERSAAHSHFLDLCELLGEPKPTDVDLEGAEYTFERGVSKSDGGKGWADVLLSVSLSYFLAVPLSLTVREPAIAKTLRITSLPPHLLTPQPNM